MITHQSKEKDFICNLLRSTKPIFESFNKYDRKRISIGHAPAETKSDGIIAKFLVDNIHAKFPNDSIIAEDFDPLVHVSSKATWIIDPIDGTIPFMSHIPTFMVSIYRQVNGILVSAYAYDPTQDLLYASVSDNLTCNSKIVKVSDQQTLSEARILISAHALDTMPNLYADLRKAGAFVIVQEGLIFRSLLVASGHADATIQTTLKTFEAGTIIKSITAAGGIVLDVPDKQIPDWKKTTNNVIISNNHLFNPLHRIVTNNINNGSKK